ncbi:MAG TPA: NAD-dependent epimerase/dehydratase family protein [Chloroflexi bacterium]|nr:NAD-dependent epimerase/dehydratase family protein [Chloroflexota bacterium]
MRVLLIGGSGFIGRYVVERLQQRGHEVTIFHRGETAPLPDVDVPRIFGNRLEIDRHIDEIMAARPEAVIDFLPWNDTDTERVVRALNGRVERVVHLSSGDVYRAWGSFLKGRCDEPVPLTEEAPLREEYYPYAGTHPGMEDYDKLLAERVILNAHYNEGYPGVILRLPVVYGPGDRQHRTWEYVRRMLDRRPVIVMGRAQGAWLWQRGYVEDVAYAIALAAERPTSVGQVYNVGSRTTLSMAAWVRAIGDVLGWQGEIVLLPRERLPEHLRTDYNYQQHILYDTTKIRRELGYSELIPREEALRQTVEWEIENPPSGFDPARFDYAAEDAALNEAVGV